MKNENYIKENLNQAFADITPNILQSILQTEKSEECFENDLRDEPLFLDDINEKKRWIPMGVFTCVIAVCIFATAFMFSRVNIMPKHKLATITFDINPSMDIQLDEHGKIVSAVANNKDAEEIVRRINRKVKKNSSSETVLEYLIKQLEKAEYLKDEKAVMLVSANKNESGSTENLKNIKNIISNYKKNNNKKFVTVYYEYEETEDVDKIAMNNEISIAKAAYCLKVSEKTDANVDEICCESISELTNQFISAAIDENGNFDINEDDIEFVGEESNNGDKETDNETLSNGENESEEQSESELASEAIVGLQETSGESVSEAAIEETTNIREEAVVLPGVYENNTEQMSKAVLEETTVCIN